MSHEKRIINAAGCSHSLTVFNTDTVKTHVEPESATDAARSDSSGCATVAIRYYKFIDDCHLCLTAAKLYLGKLGGQLARASQ